MKGSWNLALQTLGWGRYLAEQRHQTPVLWQAAKSDPLLSQGAAVLLSGTLPQTSTTWSYTRECENPDQSTVGQWIARPDAFAGAVHGQFGVVGASPWAAKPGEVAYLNINTPRVVQLYFKLRYRPASAAGIP